MAVFEYSALDNSGRREDGVLDAESPHAVARLLRQRGRYPTRVTPVAAPDAKTPASGWSWRHRVPPRTVAIFTRQFAVLLKAGIPLVPALDATCRHTANAIFHRVLKQIKETVSGGGTLAQALATQPRFFPPVYIGMVRAGEASGSLGPVLEELAVLLDRRQNLESRLSGALVYPLFMLVVGMALLAVLFTVLVPELARIFQEAGHALPLPTRILLHASALAQSFWWLPFVFLGGSMAGIGLARKNPAGRLFLDRMLLRAPLAGSICRQLAVSRFCRLLAVMLRGGVPLLAALGLAGQASGNLVLGVMAEASAMAVRRGESLGLALERQKILPPPVLELINAGEQGAALPELLQQAAAFQEMEAEESLRVLITLIEPCMILVMGAVIGFVVVSIFLPILEMNVLVH